MVGMPSVFVEVETVHIEEKEFTVKGYTLKQDLSSKKFTNEEIAHFLIDRFYICPTCNKIQRGWALYEEKVNGIILRKFFLKCKHVFTTLTGLEVVDIEYKEMFVIWLRVETINVQLIQRSDSILSPFMQYLQQSFTGLAAGNYTVSLLPISGIIATNGASASGYTVLGGGAGSGSSSAGIVIGTSNVANSPSTYALGSQIANGTSAGQMQYGATGSSVSTMNNPVSMLVTRTFTNGSGASITVAEVGIYINNTNEFYFALARDVLASPITVANTQSLAIYYTFQLTIS